MRAQLAKAQRVDDVGDIERVAAAAAADEPLLLSYSSMPDFARIANYLHIMNDEKAGVPRTAYHGIVSIRRKNKLIFIAPVNYKL